MESIFQEFGETAPDPKEVLVLGVDNGDGELVVSRAFVEQDGEGNQRLSAEPLYITNEPRTTDFAIWSYCGKDAAHMTDERIGRQAFAGGEGSCYSNYKRLPKMAADFYGGMTDSITYEEIMGRAFGLLIKKVTEENRLAPDRDIYLFVGRPSSDKWKNQAKRYRDILMSHLPESDGGKRIHVVVISEAMAVMANEYRRDRDLCQKTVVIFDGGSSTFDCIVSREGKIVCEYSRQLGAGMLDKNLLDICLHGTEELRRRDGQGKTVWTWKKREAFRAAEFSARDTEGRKIYSYGVGKELSRVRDAKERFFGPDGHPTGDPEWYQLPAKTGEAVRMINIAEVIDFAVGGMPVFVAASYDPGQNDVRHCGEDREYASFSDAVRDFFYGAFEKMNRSNICPDEIIISGGATLMPFVEELMREAFRNVMSHACPPDIFRNDSRSVERHYSVSNGVAYMGYLELLKQETFRKAKRSCVDALENKRDRLNQMVVRSCAECLYGHAETVLDRWKTGDEKKSLDDALKRANYHMRYKLDWEKKLEEDLRCFLSEPAENETSLLNCFDGMISDAAGDLFPEESCYEYHLRMDALTSVRKYKPQVCVPPKVFYRGFFRNWLHSVNRHHTSQLLEKSQREWLTGNYKKKKQAVMVKMRSELLYGSGKQDMDRICEDVYRILQTNLDESLQEYVDGLTAYMIMEDFNA
ncbi:MAG: hypothetical protein LIO80_09940 [Lachnospiraceae bacterium]|nr:hypothetical protein [Lachnospiraceae bacterium]